MYVYDPAAKGPQGGFFSGMAMVALQASKRTKRIRQRQIIKQPSKSTQNHLSWDWNHELSSQSRIPGGSPGIPGGSWTKRSARDSDRVPSTTYICMYIRIYIICMFVYMYTYIYIYTYIYA